MAGRGKEEAGSHVNLPDYMCYPRLDWKRDPTRGKPSGFDCPSPRIHLSGCLGEKTPTWSPPFGFSPWWSACSSSMPVGQE